MSKPLILNMIRLVRFRTNGAKLKSLFIDLVVPNHWINLLNFIIMAIATICQKKAGGSVKIQLPSGICMDLWVIVRRWWQAEFR